MKLNPPRYQPGYICCIMTVLSLFLLLSCKSDPNPSDHTGSLSMQFSYRGSAGGFQALTSKLDCDQTGIDQIVATVYDKSNADIANGGPWKCKDGKGTISSVKAGPDRSVVIVGKDADDKIVFRGQRTGIKIVASKVNETGNIECDDFVPRLKTPENRSFAKAGAIDLKWTGVDAAKGYEVLIFENEEMDQPLFTKETTEPECEISGLLSNEKTYYWQVVAFDDQKNESARSEKWSFTTGFSASIASPTAAGKEHTLAIRGGKLWSWGNNTYGQLGLGSSGDNTERTQPTQVGSDTHWAHVAAGPYYSIAIKKNGTMWSWGKNEYKVLGQEPDASKVTSPTQIGKESDWDYVAAGDYHVVAIKNGGELWVWGANKYGQLGSGDNLAQTQPTQMDSGGWAYVTAGGAHTLGIKTNGELWAWGQNKHGQLGISGTDNRLRPVRVNSDRKWAYVSTSMSHTVAVTTSGELWAWGDNADGQLGLGQGTTKKHDLPVKIGTDTDWIYAAAADNYSLAIKKSGKLWVWGANDLGQLGLGDTDGRTVATKITDEDWDFVSANWSHAAAVTKDNEIWCWGKNTFGEIGNGKMRKRTLPGKVGEDTDWKTISRGYGNSATFVTKSNGELWAWGRNQEGQLGLGDVGHQLNPTQVGEDAGWASVSNGSGFTVAIKEDEPGKGGILWSWWGWGSRMEPAPRNSNDEGGWIWVSAGPGFCAGIKETGADKKRTLWAWGSNNHGQLGLGDDESSDWVQDPVQVGEGTSWRTVVAGGDHAVALKTNGTLWTWGRNDWGQLGLGDTGEEKNRNSPTQVGTDTSWVTVAAGHYYSMAIKDDGTLWTWGSDLYDQLGHSDQIKIVPVPTQIETEDSVKWRHAAAGRHYGVAIKADGTLWSWGNNKYGQLGYEPSGEASNRPSQIGTDADWVSVGASYRHVLALKEDGTLYSWGDNTYGQLGDGEALQLSPYRVSF